MIQFNVNKSREVMNGFVPSRSQDKWRIVLLMATVVMMGGLCEESRPWIEARNGDRVRGK